VAFIKFSLYVNACTCASNLSGSNDTDSKMKREKRDGGKKGKGGGGRVDMARLRCDHWAFKVNHPTFLKVAE
jgi:hypothetical protein